jgi:hypothetical protein
MEHYLSSAGCHFFFTHLAFATFAAIWDQSFQLYQNAVYQRTLADHQERVAAANYNNPPRILKQNFRWRAPRKLRPPLPDTPNGRACG